MKIIKILTMKEVEDKMQDKFDDVMMFIDTLLDRILKLEEEVKTLNIVIDKMRERE